jgi:hypothetical protein
VLRNNKVLIDYYNEGYHFTAEAKAALQDVEHGDHVLITNLKGCVEGGGELKPLEFTID